MSALVRFRGDRPVSAATSVNDSAMTRGEPGFRLDRTETSDQRIHHTPHSYAAEEAHGTRYQKNGSGPEPDRPRASHPPAPLD
jgi:hypothetical protein